MAYILIKVGAVLFLIGVLCLWLVDSSSNAENPAAGLGVIGALFPILFSLVLVVPSTFYQLIVVVKSKSRQSTGEKFFLLIGISISLFFMGYFLR